MCRVPVIKMVEGDGKKMLCLHDHDDGVENEDEDGDWK